MCLDVEGPPPRQRWRALAQVCSRMSALGTLQPAIKLQGADRSHRAPRETLSALLPGQEAGLSGILRGKEWAPPSSRLISWLFPGSGNSGNPGPTSTLSLPLLRRQREGSGTLQVICMLCCSGRISGRNEPGTAWCHGTGRPLKSTPLHSPQAFPDAKASPVKSGASLVGPETVCLLTLGRTFFFPLS